MAECIVTWQVSEAFLGPSWIYTCLLEINLKLATACYENGNIIVANTVTVDLSELAVVQCDSL